MQENSTDFLGLISESDKAFCGQAFGRFRGYGKLVFRSISYGKVTKNVKKNQKNFESGLKQKKADIYSKDSFISDLDLATKGLFYISETDAEVLPFLGQKVNENSRAEILRQTGNSEDSDFEEREFSEFFERLTKFQGWFGEGEKNLTEKFLRLRGVLESNLRDIKVYRIGKIRIDIYCVGINRDHLLQGIRTFAVET